MVHGLGKDGWPSDETVLKSRDKEVEQLRETLAGIANVAHCGGQAGMTKDDALNAIRKLSLPHFDLNSTIDDQMSEINRLKRLLNINYGKIGVTDDPHP